MFGVECQYTVGNSAVLGRFFVPMSSRSLCYSLWMAIQPYRLAGSSHMLVFRGAIVPAGGTPGGNGEIWGDGMIRLLFADATDPTNGNARFGRIFDDQNPRTGMPRPLKDQTWVHNTYVHVVPLDTDASTNITWVGKDWDITTEVDLVDGGVEFANPALTGIPCLKLRFDLGSAVPTKTEITIEIRHTVNR